MKLASIEVFKTLNTEGGGEEAQNFDVKDNQLK